jgi:hypothetical protein
LGGVNLLRVGAIKIQFEIEKNGISYVYPYPSTLQRKMRKAKAGIRFVLLIRSCPTYKLGLKTV